MCTASILNLCAISLDRYVAVTRPVNYPSIMSSSRAKILIAGVWILSFVICFPPLVGWKDSKPGNGSLDFTEFHIRHQVAATQRPPETTSHGSVDETTITPSLPQNVTEMFEVNTEEVESSSDYDMFRTNYGNNSDFEENDGSLLLRVRKRLKKSIDKNLHKRVASFSGVPVVSVNNFHYPSHGIQEHPFIKTSESPSTTVEPLPEFYQCPWICELTSDTGYVIYSALGSFFIPMGVMLFFYWRIYRAAVQTTRAINQGFRTTKGLEF